MMLRVMCQKFCATRSGPTYSKFISGKSFEVTTAFTPGSEAAFVVSIERMRACAWGERRMRPVSMPGIAMSEPYSAVPVTFGTPSGRIGRVPTHLKPFVSGAATSFTAVSLAGVEQIWVKGRARPPQMQAARPPGGAGLAFPLAHPGDAMPALAYTAPSSVEEPVRALAGAAGLAKVLSGGTDLLVQLRSGRTTPSLIVDTKKIPGISGIREENGAFVIGAATSGAVIGENKRLQHAWPGLVEAANLIGSTQVQGRASLAGNLCNASPAADSVPALIAARATCVIAGSNGRREVLVETICTGPGRTSLARDEFIIEFRLPKRSPRSADAYLRFIPRTEMDIAVVGAAVNLTRDASGVITDARVVLGAVAPTAV